MNWFKEYVDLSNPTHLWSLFIAATLLCFFALRVAKAILHSRVPYLLKRANLTWSDIVTQALEKTKSFVLFLFATHLMAQTFPVPDRARLLISRLMFLGLTLQLAIWGSVAITLFAESYLKRHGDDGGKLTTMRAASFLGRLIFFSILVLWALDNIGVNITTLIAGLGVGGIAIALAVQNILGDLFASLSIVLDKPFVIGDFIVVGDFQGTIENIGLKTTRVRSLWGEQVVFPNADLLQSRVRNFKRMNDRRIVMNLGVTYQTSGEHLRKIPEIAKRVLQVETARVRFERAHFKQFGASSLDFEIVFWVLSADYNVYMDVQQNINFAIHSAFEQEGIEFAYPTQTLYLERETKGTKVHSPH